MPARGQIINTVAGGAAGDGEAIATFVRNPSQVAVDSSGNLYVADSGTHRIRKVTAATGLMTTVAGTGSVGCNGDNIVATAASLFYPAGVAITSSGNLCIADRSNDRMRLVAPPVSTGSTLDVDNNGSKDALSDGLLTIRYLFGLTGSTLTNGAIGAGAQRRDSNAIVTYLSGRRFDIVVNATSASLT